MLCTRTPSRSLQNHSARLTPERQKHAHRSLRSNMTSGVVVAFLTAGLPTQGGSNLAERRSPPTGVEGMPTSTETGTKVAAALLVRHGVVAINILRDGSEEPVTATLLRTKPANIPAEIRDQALAIATKAAAADPSIRRKAR